MVEWRRPLANLTAAAETAGRRSGALGRRNARAFEDIVGKEVGALNERFRDLSRRYEQLTAGPWPMSDIHSLDLFRAVRKHLADGDGIELTLVGVPLWLQADSHSLMLALEHLIRAVASTRANPPSTSRRCPAGQLRVYVEVSWEGAPVPSAAIDGLARRAAQRHHRQPQGPPDRRAARQRVVEQARPTAAPASDCRCACPSARRS